MDEQERVDIMVEEDALHGRTIKPGRWTEAEQRHERDRNAIADLEARIEELESINEGHVEDKATLHGRIEELKAAGRSAMAERDELAEQLGRTIPIQNEPYLGLATTEEMFRELICRFRMEQYVDSISVSAYAAVDRALILAEMLGGMGAPEREYRTVDHG